MDRLQLQHGKTKTVYGGSVSSGTGKRKAGIIALLLMMAAVSALSISCGSGYSNNDHSCQICGATPTKKFSNVRGDAVYICEPHSTTCFLCGEKASKHYTSMLEIEVFVCNTHWDEVRNFNKR